MVEYTLEWLRANGVTEVAINLHHSPEPLRGHVGDGATWGVQVRYSPEAILLGSAGALVPLRVFFATAEPFVVIYGDVLTDLDLAPLVRRHEMLDATVTLAVTTAEDPTRCGVVGFERDGRVTRLVEKPAREDVFSSWVNAGVYVCSPALLDLLPDPCPVPYDFGHDLFPSLLARGVRLAACPSDARVIDVGSLERLDEASAVVRSGWLGSTRPVPC